MAGHSVRSGAHIFVLIRHTRSNAVPVSYRCVTAARGALVTETNPGMDLQTVLEQYADEIRRCRYGSFRGVIKDGKIVIFAVEQEWRPQLETHVEPRDTKAER